MMARRGGRPATIEETVPIGSPAVLWCDDPLPADAAPLVGAKAQGLFSMYHAGLPVPPFFVVTTAAAEHPIPSRGLEPEVQVEIRRGLQRLEEHTGRSLGDERNPLLLAVRCSADDAPAGLLPSAQNLGMSPRVAQTLLARTADDRFVFDCYRRLIAQLGRLVHDIDPIHFERDLRAELDNRGLAAETDLDGWAMRELVRRWQGIYSIRAAVEFPNEPLVQFSQAVLAALKAGEQPRVLALRRTAGGPLPVAVIVQAMVFGNRATDSVTGVAYTRDPTTGEDALRGEFIPVAQGADVAAGRLPSLPITELAAHSPASFQNLQDLRHGLEKHFGDAQEFEFTLEMGQALVLHSRPAGRSAQAAVRIAVEMAEGQLISRDQAVQRIDPHSLETILHARFDPIDRPEPVARGYAASPGAAVGTVAFTATDAMERASRGQSVILVRRETDATDVIGMQQCEGILTSTGGMTSHAAVVARGMGRCCVAGAGDLEIDEQRRIIRVGRYELGEEDIISIDGTSGEVYVGKVRRIEGEITPWLIALLQWADEARRSSQHSVGIYANVDTPDDARLALRLGAEGVGLCRTEHMFFAPRRITLMRKMILAGRDDTATRQAALEALLPYQRQDFTAIFGEMSGKSVVIRLLDPPLHEFLPHGQEDQKEIARELGMTQREVRRRIEQLHEVNPMLGHRGCRIAVSFPEILQMQVQAIVAAAIDCVGKGYDARPKIMVPLTISREEMALMHDLVRHAAEQAMRAAGVMVEYQLGTMIETPRAALVAGSLAEHAQFFSFGTNDLTQTAMAISRDDAATFMGSYQQMGLVAVDPFRSVDQEGVGELIRMAIERGRAARPDLECGVCGEHAGDPDSIAFFLKAKVSYISCSPMRLPIARLAAAQAVLREAP